MQWSLLLSILLKDTNAKTKLVFVELFLSPTLNKVFPDSIDPVG